jgi:DNA-binding beta-propeller fold protein YncE
MTCGLPWNAPAQSTLGTHSWLAPAAGALTPDGNHLVVAAQRARQLLILDVRTRQVVGRAELKESPSGVTSLGDGANLLLTCTGASDFLLAVDPQTLRVLRSVRGGPGVQAPVAAGMPQTVYACYRFANRVVALDPRTGRSRASYFGLREPVATSVSPDGQTLAVVSLLPDGPANAARVQAGVSLLDASSLKPRAQIELPNGSASARGLAFHPTKPVCAVVHNIGRHAIPTTQVEHGWMNVSALSLISSESGQLLGSVVLDEARRGAANPWAVAWSKDGRRLCVTHAGTHEVSVMDWVRLEDKLARVEGGKLINDFSFLQGIRVRVPTGGNGPRAMAVHGSVAYVLEYFSDSVCAVDLAQAKVLWRMQLGSGATVNPAWEGERLFHDASISHQGWQSCATCHPDGRADGLNWDLLNDGIGNPKNTKSLLLAHQTPPAMSSGARDTAEQAVRSGLRHILFAPRAEADAVALDEYLRSLRPAANPFLAKGKLSRVAERGKRLFEDPKVGCAECHPAPFFTDRTRHSVGPTQAGRKAPEALDTPTLVECWRTAPYLHDGSAVTLKEMLTDKNLGNTHGRTTHLTGKEIEELVAYVLSL